MSNDWWKYTQEDDSNEEQDPRKVLDEEFEFTIRNSHWYLLALVLGLFATAMFVGVFLSIMSMIYN